MQSQGSKTRYQASESTLLRKCLLRGKKRRERKVGREKKKILNVERSLRSWKLSLLISFSQKRLK